MIGHALHKRPLGFGELVSSAWDISRDNGRLFLLATLLFLAPLDFLPVDALLPGSMTSYHGGQLTALVVGAGLMLVASLMGTLLLIVMTADATGKRRADMRAVFRRAWGTLFWALLTMMLFTVVIALGATVLIPGILALNAFAFSLHAVALRARSGSAALRYSWTLVKGRFWRVFGINILTVILFFFTGMLLSSALDNANPVARVLASAVSALLAGFGTVVTTLFFLNLDAVRKQ
jgi:hypothetical protein